VCGTVRGQWTLIGKEFEDGPLPMRLTLMVLPSDRHKWKELESSSVFVVRGCVTTPRMGQRRLVLPPFFPCINAKRLMLFLIAWSVYGLTSGSVGSA
jgi:hypothetical protein